MTDESPEGGAPLSSDEEGLDALLEYLHRNRGFDFGGYKRTSLVRRIRRRMQVVGITTFREYLDHLEVHPNEFPQLFNTLLINVTSFFRDPTSWEALETRLPQAVDLSGDGPIRVWSAGCSTGEEPYTLAMVLCELLGTDAFLRRAKVYATDVDDDALASARLASYSSKAVESIPADLREKYFVPSGASFTFQPDLRRTVIFGRHDLVQDAPIPRVDVLSCRNTLMYFNAETQTRILGRLQFALNPGGILMLGKAELLLTHADLFTPVDLKQRLFTRATKSLRGRERAPEPLAQIVIDGTGPRTPSAPPGCDRRRAAPAAALAEAGAVLGVQVSFADVTPAHRLEAELRRTNEELAAAHGELQSTSEELETTNEELQSTVEELETTNEELQSTNEELEAMNEELQSTNEELQTINEELRLRGVELNNVNAFHAAVLGSLHTGIAVLDRELMVRTWNDSMRELWGLRGEEVSGKHFLNLDIGLPVDQLASAIRSCLVSGEESDRRMSCTNRRGKNVECKVCVVPLRDDGLRGVIVLVEELP